MEKKTRIIAHYDQYSPHYSEDTWEKSRVVENMDDVFQFMKDCHLEDAGHRNNYPITSCWNRWVDFTSEEYIIVDGKTYYSNVKESIAAPDYYEEAKQKYREWEIRLKTVLEKQKQHRKEMRQNQEDWLNFQILKEKFNQ